MGSALLSALASSAAAQDCPDEAARIALVAAAESSLVEADLETTETHLRTLEAAFGCGAVASPELLGRLWLVEGAWLTLSGEAGSAAASWQAAARVAPGRWTSDFGSQLRGAYDEAVEQDRPQGTATIVVDPDLVDFVGSVDGRPVTRFPVEVEPGLHLVQVGASEDDQRFARVILTFPNTPVVVVTGLVEQAEPVASPSATTPSPAPLPARSPLTLHVASGAALGLGQASTDGVEPGAKLVIPLETGVVLRPGQAIWIRPSLRVGALLGGDFAYEDTHGPSTTPSTLGFDLAGGAALRRLEVGVLAGYHWPERVAVRATGGAGLGELPLAVEGRLGLDLPGGASPELAVEAVVAFRPRLVRPPAP